MKNLSYLVTILIILTLSSCDDNKFKAKDPEKGESLNSGKLSVSIDSSLFRVLQYPLEEYISAYPKVELTKQYKNSIEVMKDLLSGNSRAVVLGRDYTILEDSIIKVNGLEPHSRITIAYDGLVFFGNKNFPIDTLNLNMIKNAFLEGKDFSKELTAKNITPSFYIRETNSSEYLNFLKFVKDNQTITKQNLKFINSDKELFDRVKENPYAIGISLLSKTLKEDDIKMIKIGYTDTDGQHISPKPVHQGYIVQDLYPFKIPIDVYLLEPNRNIAYWFGVYLEKETKIQQHFNGFGIVPAFARVKLIIEE